MVRRRNRRKDRWVYDNNHTGEIVAVKLYGSNKILGKVVRHASKMGQTWMLVHPIAVVGKISRREKWYIGDKITIICSPNLEKYWH